MIRRALALWLLVLALPAAAQTRLPVVDHVVLPAEAVDGWRPAELSGLAWHAATGELMAVSDRGRWLRWRLELAPGRIVRLLAVAAGRLGTARVNAEAVVHTPGLDGAGAWLVADEAAHQLVRLDAAGRPVGTRPLPPGLASTPTGRRGVEALAWHPRHGLIAALQRPDDRHHHLHGDDGLLCRVPVSPGGRATLKDMHLQDDRTLLLLEKLDTGVTHRTLLRRVDLAHCDAAPATWLLDPDGPQAALNFEGLTCVDARRCLLVSDDAGRPGQAVLVLVEWP